MRAATRRQLRRPREHVWVPPDGRLVYHGFMDPAENDTPQSAERRSDERRRHFTPLRHPERRTGFDRREEGRGGPLALSIEGLRDSGIALATVLAAINALNLIDLLLTLRLLDGGALEANPVMDILIGRDPLVALFVKAAIVAAVSIAIWRQRRYRLILATGLLVLVAFVALTAYELWLVSAM